MSSKHKSTSTSNLTAIKRSTGETQDEYLYRQIFDAMLSQRLLPSTKLVEEELAEIFAVNRAIVRRALLRLSHDGIVEIRPNRGASVASFSVKQAREILAARRLIEGAIVRGATAVATKNEVAELRALVEQEKTFIEHAQRGRGIRLSGDFHFRLALLTDNATLIRFIKSLIPQTSLIIAQYEKPGHSTCSYDEHYRLIDAIAAGDSKRAAALMEEHLEHIENKLNLTDDEARTNLRQVFADINKPVE